jgi:hypothetical protein
MELRVYANGFEALGFKHEIAEGDEFINAVGSMFIPSMGRVLFVEWTWGARTVGLTLYRLTPDGTIKEIFHDGGTDGYRLVELGRDREIELVILDKDERSNEYVARSYVVTRSGDFEKPPESSARGLSSLN